MPPRRLSILQLRWESTSSLSGHRNDRPWPSCFAAASRPTWPSTCLNRFTCLSSDDPRKIVMIGGIPKLRIVEASFSNPKECFQRSRAQDFPNFDHFIGDDSGKADGEPNADCFDRQAGPCSDVKPDQNITAVFPPAIRQGESHFPQQTHKEQQKKRETKRAPVDEPLRGVKKAGRRNKRSADEINKIPRKPIRCTGDELAVHNCGCDQDDTKDDRSKMKTNDARYILGRFLVVRDVVSCHPIFVAPDVTQQDEHEACQIKNEFFNWNRPA